jgi:KDO2-lipid IV(A) lauroyltransferase
MVVIYLSINRVKRGFYEGEFKVICEDPSKAGEFEITRRYFGILEKIIRKNPEFYLWTHKRWKYRRDDAKDPVDIGTLSP